MSAVPFFFEIVHVELRRLTRVKEEGKEAEGTVLSKDTGVCVLTPQRWAEAPEKGPWRQSP